jgi:thiamine pyrophosphokinase
MDIVIIGNGVIKELNQLKKYINKKDFIICADGGLVYAESLSVIPDIIIGDMDSIKNINPKNYKNSEIIKYPKDKDKTDAELSILKAIELKPQKITLLGFTGNRIDHFLSVLSLTNIIAKEGIKSLLVDEANEIYTIYNEITLKKDDKKYLSIIPVNEIAGILYIKGTKYEISNMTIKRESSFGISNEITDEYAEIKTNNDGIYIIKSKDER